MEQHELSPYGDLPPNHPMVLEALKGIIAGPISELRTKVDGLITNPSNTLKKGEIDYNNILPLNNQPRKVVDETAQITNQLLDNIAPVHYQGHIPVNQPVFVNQPIQVPNNVQEYDPNQMELPLFKQTTVDDIQNKLFDIERKIDSILKHVKNPKNQK
jgi:hypothetical protein